MIELGAVAAVAAAAGFCVWGLDKRHHSYGLLLLPGISLAVALVVWIVLVMTGLSYTPGIFWLSWLIPMLAGPAAAAIAARVLGRRRWLADIQRLSRVLR